MKNQSSISSQPRSFYKLRQSTFFWWLICVVAFSLLYMFTCQRGVSWQDSGMFQHRVLVGDYHGDLGLALAHPLYIAAGQALKAIPIADLFTRLNFFSGLGTAIALANLMAVITLLTKKRWIGVLVVAMLSLCHTVWWLSTIAEVYSWSLAGLTGELWLLILLLQRPKWQSLCGLALISGLGLAVHNFALLPLPVYLVIAVVLIAKRRLSPVALAGAAAAYIAGAGLYIVMIVQQALAGGSLGGAIHSALFGNYVQQVLNAAEVSQYLKANAALAAMNLANPLVPLAIVGWFNFRKYLTSTTAWSLAAITVIQVLFVLRYPVPDQFTFLLPTLVMISIAAGVGIMALANISKTWRRVVAAACVLSVLAMPIFYSAAPSIVRSAGMEIKRTRQLPFRDELCYWLVPWKHNENSAELFAAAALKQASPDGVILADSTSDEAIVLVQMRDAPGEAVTVQFDGGPLTPYNQDPQAFRRELGTRQLYAVATTAGHTPKRLLADEKLGRVRFHRGKKQVLYEVQFTGHLPRQ